MKHVCYFRHALALDERRVKFLPEYAYGGTNKPPEKPEDEMVSPVNPQPPRDDKKPSTGDADGQPPTTNTQTIDHPLKMKLWMPT